MPRQAPSHRTSSTRNTGLPNVANSLRLWVGLTIVALGIAALLQQLWSLAATQPAVWQALAGSMVAALATTLGAVPVLFAQRISERTQDTLLGFGAGVMLAACAFSLILPGMEAVQAQKIWGGTQWAASGIVGLSIVCGGGLMMLIDRLLPHEHFIKGREGPDPTSSQHIQRAWLFVFAIALHNIPEGLAIGVAYASNGVGGNALTTGIAIQDIPEGLVVAIALISAGYGRATAFLVAMATGLMEPVGAVAGALLIGISAALLPWALGLAAGAMLFVVSHEIIPESHRKGHERFATTGLMVGFVMMMMMDTALG